MPYVIAVSLVMFLLCVPISARSHTAGIAEQGFLLENLRVGIFPSIAFRIEYIGGKITVYGAEKKPRQQKKPKNGMKIDVGKLSAVRIRSAYVNGYFGCKDAALTSLISGAGLIFVNIFMKTMLPPADKISVDIRPVYDREGASLNLKLNLQFNLLIIIFIFASILFKRSGNGV